MFAAIRRNVIEPMKFSPWNLLYNRDIVLPLGNILKPRRLNYGDEHHDIALQEQHRTFTLVRNNLKKAGKRQKERSNITSNDVDFNVGDLVYYRNDHKRNKLEMSWGLYYVIIEKTRPISYKVNDLLTISVVKAQAENLSAGNIEEWIIHTVNRLLWMETLAVPVLSEESKNDSGNEGKTYLKNKWRRQWNDSEDEPDIPMMERHIAMRQRKVEENDTAKSMEQK